MATTGKVLASVLAGVAVGTALGVLFAPDKGSETRKKIMRKGNDLKDQVDEWTEKGSQKLQSAKDEAQNLIDRGRSRADESKRDLRTS